MMIKSSLFAAEEREAKLNKLGDVLQDLEEHIIFRGDYRLPEELHLVVESVIFHRKLKTMFTEKEQSICANFGKYYCQM